MQVHREADSLQQAQKKLARDAEQVTEETYMEAKRLLRLFGVPYIEAPMEVREPLPPPPTPHLPAYTPTSSTAPLSARRVRSACMQAEAQCAQLEASTLVDGIATEDNDVFLFGGRHVYKHLFDQRHHVEVGSMDGVQGLLEMARDGF